MLILARFEEFSNFHSGGVGKTVRTDISSFSSADRHISSGWQPERISSPNPPPT